MFSFGLFTSLIPFLIMLVISVCGVASHFLGVKHSDSTDIQSNIRQAEQSMHNGIKEHFNPFNEEVIDNEAFTEDLIPLVYFVCRNSDKQLITNSGPPINSFRKIHYSRPPPVLFTFLS